MRLPNGSVLMHADVPYDPSKAHEYYMRTRRLKGRKAGGGTYTVVNKGKQVKLSAQQLAEQKAYADHQVAQMKQKLSDLSVVLRDKMQKAQAASAKSAKPPTLADKAKAARAAEAYRKSHKQTLKNKASQAPTKAAPAKSKAKVDTVDSLKKEIVTTKNDLKAAVAKQRELATAKKNG